MPELPEVEATRRLLIRHARGHRVVSIAGGDDDKIFEGAGADAVRAAFVGRSIADGHRLGKQFWLSFDDASGPTPVMHLGMTGQVWVRTAEGGLDAVSYVRDVGNGNTAGDEQQEPQWPPRFAKLELELSSGARIALCDARRFGRVRLIPAGVDPLTRPPLGALGFDPLLSMPPLDAFSTLLARRRSAKLKALLLDQSFSAGVGNWVADDVLWQARLHPEQKVGDLLDAAAAEEDDGVARLHAAIRGVCERACSVDADSARFPQEWLFHHRWTGGKTTRLPTGERVEFITAGGRTTAYVPAVQKMIKGKGKGGAAAGGGGTKKKKPQKKEEEDDEEDEEAAAMAAVAETGDGKTKKKKKRAKEEEEDEDDDDEVRGQKQQQKKRPARRAAAASGRRK